MQTNYPEKIVLGGQEYVVNDTPELKKFFDETVTVASTKEKNKLYADLEKHKKEKELAVSEKALISSQLQQSLSINQQQLSDYEKARNEIEELRKGSVGNVADIAATMERAFKEFLPPILQMYMQPVNEITAKIKNDGLKTYRDQIIADAKERLFPELVKGTSPEELDASLAASKALWEKHVGSKIAPAAQPAAEGTEPVAAQPAATQPGTQPAATAPGAESPAPAIMPVVSKMNNPVTTDLPDIKNMSDDEFEKRRVELFQKVGAIAKSYETQVAGNP